MALLTPENMQRLHRDAQCAADVKQMEELGKFPVEFRVYGAADRNEAGEIFYRATEDEEKLYDYMRKERLNGNVFTPIKTEAVYEKATADEKAQMMYQMKLGLLQAMKRQYEVSGFWRMMAPFFETPAIDAAVDVIDAFREKIDGYFDDVDLQLLQDLMDRAFDAKILTLGTYKQFQGWVDDVKRQMDEVPVVEEFYKRTLYGFVYYGSNGQPKVFCDARKMTVVHKRDGFLQKGFLVGAIVHRRYSFPDMQELSSARDAYKKWIVTVEDAAYFEQLAQLKALKGVISHEALADVKAAFETNSEAYQAICYYEALWNDSVPVGDGVENG